MSQGSSSDSDILVRIALLLRYGVIAAALVLIFGGGVYLARHSFESVPDRHRFEPQPSEFTSPSALIQAALEGRGRAIIQLGLLLLIATPILRVAYTVLAFAWRRDWVYVLISSFVLFILFLGIAFAPMSR